MTTEQIKQKIEEQIQKIQPVLTAHGGGAEIMQISSEGVVIGLKGHCAGCALAPVTFGIVLKKYISEALPGLEQVTFVDKNMVEKLVAEKLAHAEANQAERKQKRHV